MASSFSANQYDSAFKAQRLQNWCEAKHFKERPSARVGHTFIADDKGHLLPGVKKGSARPDFKGTWDLPARIPAQRINPTARSAEGLSRLRTWGFCPQQSARSQQGRRRAEVGEKTTQDVQEDGADPVAPAKTQSQPGTRNQNHRSQTSVIVSAEHQASEKDRLINQTSAGEENPTSPSTDDIKKTSNGPETNESMTRSRLSHLQRDL